MCGIAGVVELQPSPRGPEVVRRIVESQHRRGPDHNAVVTIGGRGSFVTLGHNRLKIIDLSDASNQPMWDVSNRCCIVFNGEIYNYVELRQELQSLGARFATQGDTEVILEAYKRWGHDAFPRLFGMFAFGLWDKDGEELILVRDRFGVKPLYYVARPEAIYFASTASVIASDLGLKPRLDYLIRGIDQMIYEHDSNITQFDGLDTLLPGQYLRAALSGAGKYEHSIKPYYDLTRSVMVCRERVAASSRGQILDELMACIESAVDMRLRADVPVGISLSGGLDSASIAALVAARNTNVTAFSFGHPSDAYSEGASAQRIVARNHLQVVYCRPTPEEVIEATWETLRVQEAPFAGGSIVAQHLVFRAARERGVIVLMGGQGADEGLMGYHKFQMFLLQEAWRKRDIKRALQVAVGIMAVAFNELSNLREYWKHKDRFVRRAQASSSILTPPDVVRLPSHGLSPDDPVWKRQVMDVLRFSLPTLLRYEDRNSMGNSVESRLPFMDHRFLELGIALPEVMKVHRGYGKWALRELMGGSIPASIRTSRAKRGFDVNLVRWIDSGLGAALRARLSDLRSGYAPYLRRPVELEVDFSDHRLKHDRRAYTEATTLLWLGEAGMRPSSQNRGSAVN